MNRSQATARIAAIVVATFGVVVACEEAENYVYSAQRYDPAAACLEPYKAVEIVAGPGASLCAPTCFAVAKDVFVSTMCPPLPANATALVPDAALCIAALSADAACGDLPGSGDDDDDDDTDGGTVDAESPKTQDAGADG